MDTTEKVLVKFKGVEERQTIYIDPDEVEGIITIDAIQTNVHLPHENKDIVLIRTKKNSYGVAEPIAVVLAKLGILVRDKISLDVKE